MYITRFDYDPPHNKHTHKHTHMDAARPMHTERGREIHTHTPHAHAHTHAHTRTHAHQHRQSLAGINDEDGQRCVGAHVCTRVYVGMDRLKDQMV